MADILCGYTADRDETLVAYLYGDIDAGQRAAFDAHLATCERCRHELRELQSVRSGLQQWSAPVLDASFAMRLPLAPSRQPADRRATWRELPVWAQVAAALLVLGVAAGIANLDIRYDSAGLSVRTGWSRLPAAPTSNAQSAATSKVAVPASAAAPWRADLEALERRLQLAERVTTAPGASVAREDGASAADAQLLRKVRTLVDESERRQRNELALRIAEVVQEFDAKRGNDLANIRTLRNAQTATGVEIVRQQQYLDLLRQASMSMQR